MQQIKLFKRDRSPFWFAEYYVEKRRIRKSLKTSDKKEAVRRAKEIAESIEKKKEVRTELDTYLTEYWQYAQTQKGMRPIKDEQAVVKLFLEKYRLKYLDEITPRIVDSFLADRLAYRTSAGRALSIVTVRDYFKLLKTIFMPAVRWGHLAKNPFQGVSLPKAPKTRKRFYSFDELRQIREWFRLKMPTYSPVIEFLMWTGLRRGEAIQLEWSDVDFENRILLLTKTKTDEPRTVPMLSVVYDILKSRTHLPKPFPEYSNTTITNAFHACAKELNLNGALKHMRGTFATMMQLSGVPPKFTSMILGHTEQVEDKHYLGIPMEYIKEQMTRLEEESRKN